MKNIFKLILLFLTLFVGLEVNAKEVKINGNNYYMLDSFYCGETKVWASEYIEKTGKLVVYDNEGNNYIWSEGNVCRPETSQDQLDKVNSSYVTYESGDNPNELIRHSADVFFTKGFIKAYAGYDENETYYTIDHHHSYLVTNPSEDKYDSYYVMSFLRTAETTTVDPNETYYTSPSQNNLSTTIVDTSTVTEDDIIYYFIRTTAEEINYKKTVLSIDRDVFDSLNTYDYNLEMNGEMLVKKIDETPEYYDKTGNEVLKYHGYELGQSANFTVLKSFDYDKIYIYDRNEENLIFSIEDNGSIGDFELTDNSVIITNYVGDEVKTTFINLYKTLEGDKQTFTKDDLTIRFNGSYDSFKELRINDEVVDANNYTKKSGSTIITLKKEYLSTLKNGTYNLSAVYSDGGVAYATFSVNNISNPDTGDNIILNVVLGSISLISLVGCILYINKKKA